MKKSNINNMDVKRFNRNKLFRCVNRNGRLSRTEIVEKLGMSLPTVLSLLGELAQMGLVREAGKLESTGGRKAAAIMPVHDARFAVGLDITAHHVSFALTDLSAQVLKHVRVIQNFEMSPQYIADVAGKLEDFIQEAKVPKQKILGVGVSIPGIVDIGNSNILVSHALGISDVGFEYFSRHIPYRCSFINDANAAAFAEIFDLDSNLTAILFSLSNTVGGAIINKAVGIEAGGGVGSHLILGDNWKGGEIGHMTLFPGGIPCYCGKIGCFDAYCSAKVLSQHTGGTLEAFFEQLAEGNSRLAAVWDTYLGHLAIMLNNIRMLQDCSIIIGGYVGRFMEPYIELLSEKVKRLNTFRETANFIKICNYRVEASAFGAALLFIEDFMESV
ncbi:MAG: ROK family transcriptional regulator [Oscillospiraceae bacterium]|nr:ROK family transcriptional regulator [Oscillospiraceae bacterium]